MNNELLRAEIISVVTLLNGASAPDYRINEAKRKLNDALSSSATQPQAAMPKGWKLVPVMPTPEMLDDAGQALSKNGAEGNVLELQSDAHTAYNAMLAAAPPSPQPVAESVSAEKAGGLPWPINWHKTADTLPDVEPPMILVAHEDGCVENTLAEYVRANPHQYPFWMPMPPHPSSRQTKIPIEQYRAHVESWATKSGWANKKEGAFEFAQRTCYRQGWDDAVVQLKLKEAE